MEAAVHKRNLESSILFMQQDHAATLKALHEEIHKLQKRCTDLTFQLTMHGINVEDEGDVDSRLTQVHQQLQQSQEHESSLASQLTQGTHKLQRLEQELRMGKKRHMDEMRQATHNISSLKAEVEAKANNIAFLTTELHRLKVKHKVAEEGGGVGVQGGDSGGVPTIVRRKQYGGHHLPVPPPSRDRLTNSARMMRHREAHPLTSPSARRVAPTPTIGTGPITGAEAEALARSLRVTSASTRSSGSESPDITPFMHRDMAETGVAAVVGVKKPAPLPPIASSHPGLGERDPPLNKGDLQHLVVAQRGGRRALPRPRPPTPEVTTLAVDQVSDTKWNRPSQSHSSEYN
ncbi:hypothetical protein ACOMHN_013457 [Nucella lapillus]